MNHKTWQYLALMLLVFIEVQGLKPQLLTIQAIDSSRNNDSGPSPFQVKKSIISICFLLLLKYIFSGRS